MSQKSIAILFYIICFAAFISCRKETQTPVKQSVADFRDKLIGNYIGKADIYIVSSTRDSFANNQTVVVTKDSSKNSITLKSYYWNFTAKFLDSTGLNYQFYAWSDEDVLSNVKFYLNKDSLYVDYQEATSYYGEKAMNVYDFYGKKK